MAKNSSMPAADTDQFSRIKNTAFVGAMFLFLALAILAAAARTFLRVHRFRTLALDDVFLILAVIFMSTSVAAVYSNRSLSYTQINVSLGHVEPPADFTTMMARFEAVNDLGTVTAWATIFSVKFSFLTFFRKLILKVRGLTQLWWSVLGVLCAAAPVCMFLSFYICSDFTSNLLEVCTEEGMIHRESTYLMISVTLDIITDLLLISIPFTLLYKVQLSLKRKLALLTVLSLSAFMIVIAIIRVALAPVPGPQGSTPDSVWLFFWQTMEAATAVIMVSATAFRSMLGQQSNKLKGGHQPGSQGGYVKPGSGRGEKLAAHIEAKGAAGLGGRDISYLVGTLETEEGMPPAPPPKNGNLQMREWSSDSDEKEIKERGDWESPKGKTQKAESFV